MSVVVFGWSDAVLWLAGKANVMEVVRCWVPVRLGFLAVLPV